MCLCVRFLPSMTLETGDACALCVLLLSPLALGVSLHSVLEKPARHWHSALRKAPSRPPDAAFPFVWIYSYLAMGYASYLVFKATKGYGMCATVSHVITVPQLQAYILHYMVLQLWNVVVMWGRSLIAGVYVMLFMDVIVTALVMSWYNVAPLAAYLMVPYLCWVFILTYLNYYMYIYNPSHASIGATKDEIIRQHNSSRAASSENVFDFDYPSSEDAAHDDEPGFAGEGNSLDPAGRLKLE